MTTSEKISYLKAYKIGLIDLMRSNVFLTIDQMVKIECEVSRVDRYIEENEAIGISNELFN